MATLKIETLSRRLGISERLIYHRAAEGKMKRIDDSAAVDMAAPETQFFYIKHALQKTRHNLPHRLPASFRAEARTE